MTMGQSSCALYKDVKFCNFVELADLVNNTDKYKIKVTLKYEGTHLYGDLVIDIGSSDSNLKSEFLCKAAQILTQ